MKSPHDEDFVVPYLRLVGRYFVSVTLYVDSGFYLELPGMPRTCDNFAVPLYDPKSVVSLRYFAGEFALTEWAGFVNTKIGDRMILAVNPKHGDFLSMDLDNDTITVRKVVGGCDFVFLDHCLEFEEFGCRFAHYPLYSGFIEVSTNRTEQLLGWIPIAVGNVRRIHDGIGTRKFDRHRHLPWVVPQ